MPEVSTPSATEQTTAPTEATAAESAKPIDPSDPVKDALDDKKKATPSQSAVLLEDEKKEKSFLEKLMDLLGIKHGEAQGHGGGASIRPEDIKNFFDENPALAKLAQTAISIGQKVGLIDKDQAAELSTLVNGKDHVRSSEAHQPEAAEAKTSALPAEKETAKQSAVSDPERSAEAKSILPTKLPKGFASEASEKGSQTSAPVQAAAQHAKPSAQSL